MFLENYNAQFGFIFCSISFQNVLDVRQNKNNLNTKNPETGKHFAMTCEQQKTQNGF